MIDMKRAGVLLFPIFLFVASAFSQTQFVKTLSFGELSDRAWSVVTTANGGYVVAGYTSNVGMGSRDCLVAKFDAAGNHEWVKTLGQAAGESGHCIIQTADGGYAVGGYTSSFGGVSEALLSKLDSLGNHEWTRTVGYSEARGYDEAWSVKETTDGGYVIAGYTSNGPAGYYDALLAKFDAAGTHEWVRTLGGISGDGAFSVIQTADEGYAIAGYTESFGAGEEDFLLARFSSSGNHEWTRTLGGAGRDLANSLAQTADGGYIMTGITSSYGAGHFDVLLSKLDAAGDHEWTRTLGGVDRENVEPVIETADGGYVVAGGTWGFGAGSVDGMLAKFNAAGDYQWARSLGGVEPDAAFSLAQTTDGGYAVAGYTCSVGPGDGDILLAKFDACERTCWEASISPAVDTVFPTVGSPVPSIDSTGANVRSQHPIVLPVVPETLVVCVSTDFIRSDADVNSTIEMADAIFTLRALYVPGSDTLLCKDAGDSDDNGSVEMADAVFTLKHLYVPDSPSPPCPFPMCGGDPTPDALDCGTHPCMGDR